MSLDRHTLRQYKYSNLTYDDGNGDLGQFVPINISPPKINHGTTPRSIPLVPNSASVLTSIDERFSTLGPVIEEQGYDSDASMPLSYTYVGQLVRPGRINSTSSPSIGGSKLPGGKSGEYRSGNSAASTAASTRAPSEHSSGAGASPPCYDEVDLHFDPLMSRKLSSNLPTKSKLACANKAASIAMTMQRLEESKSRFEEKKWKKKKVDESI